MLGLGDLHACRKLLQNAKFTPPPLLPDFFTNPAFIDLILQFFSLDFVGVDGEHLGAAVDNDSDDVADGSCDQLWAVGEV